MMTKEEVIKTLENLTSLNLSLLREVEELNIRVDKFRDALFIITRWADDFNAERVKRESSGPTTEQSTTKG